MTGMELLQHVRKEGFERGELPFVSSQICGKTINYPLPVRTTIKPLSEREKKVFILSKCNCVD